MPEMAVTSLKAMLFGVVGAGLLALGVVYSNLGLSEGTGFAILGLVIIALALIAYVVTNDGIDTEFGNTME